MLHELRVVRTTAKGIWSDVQDSIFSNQSEVQVLCLRPYIVHSNKLGEQQMQNALFTIVINDHMWYSLQLLQAIAC